LSAFKALVFRLAASIVTVLVAGIFLNDRTSVQLEAPAMKTATASLSDAMMQWGAATFSVGIQILAIILVLMIILQVMRTFGLAAYLVRILMPVTWLMGLERDTAFIWLTAALFGISYGSAVIVEETNRGGFSRKTLEKLHVSIGINHAVVEDPALFLPLGVGAFWLWIPRLITAIVAARLFDLWYKFGMSVSFEKIFAHPISAAPRPKKTDTARRTKH
jgi:spore maturation protein SpmB